MEDYPPLVGEMPALSRQTENDTELPGARPVLLSRAIIRRERRGRLGLDRTAGLTIGRCGPGCRVSKTAWVIMRQRHRLFRILHSGAAASLGSLDMGTALVVHVGDSGG